jgi:hypothetical protein
MTYKMLLSIPEFRLGQLDNILNLDPEFLSAKSDESPLPELKMSNFIF